MQRIVIVGTTGSGKSTLAKRLAQKINAPYIDLDNLHHLPGWQERPVEEFRALLTEKIKGDSWVVAGNYASRAQDILWPRADTIIWLDMPFWINFWMLIRRTFTRALSGEEICNGNKETLLKQFFTKNSILWWFLKTFHKNRVRYGRQVANPAAFPGVTFIRLGSYAETSQFMK